MVVILPVLHLHLCSPEEQQRHLLAQWMQKVDELRQRIHILYQFSIPTLILDRQTMVIFSDLLRLGPIQRDISGARWMVINGELLSCYFIILLPKKRYESTMQPWAMLVFFPTLSGIPLKLILQNPPIILRSTSPKGLTKKGISFSRLPLSTSRFNRFLPMSRFLRQREAIERLGFSHAEANQFRELFILADKALGLGHISDMMTRWMEQKSCTHLGCKKPFPMIWTSYFQP